jgi:hypothetical protein
MEVKIDGKSYRAVPDDHKHNKYGCKRCDLNNKFVCAEVDCQDVHYKLMNDGDDNDKR